VLIARAGFEEDPARADLLRRYAAEHFGERSAMTWERAAEMLQKQAQPELALTCAENAIKLDPNLASAHYRKSSVLWVQKRKDESRKVAVLQQVPARSRHPSRGFAKTRAVGQRPTAVTIMTSLKESRGACQEAKF
jgi:tetratricopeptide (TPR) repeat protein